MKAIIVKEPGGPEVLEWQETADPIVNAGEVLVKVKASAINRADLLQRRGFYPPPPGASPILGLEIAGEVVQGDQTWQAGQPVMALLSGGGYAELAAVPSGQLMPIPEDLSFAEAAAIPEAFLTAYMNLFGLGQLKAGEIVLVHAGGSGVGTAAIQLARQAGAQVIVTVGSGEKGQKCADLGASYVINYKEGAFADQVKEITGGNGVNLILDFVGANYFEPNIASLAQGGRLVLIGQLSGSKAALELSTIMRRQLTITGTTLRARSLEEKAALTSQFGQFGLARFADGRLKPVVDSVYPMAQAAEAHRYMETNRNFGKIVLQVED